MEAKSFYIIKGYKRFDFLIFSLKTRFEGFSICFYTRKKKAPPLLPWGYRAEWNSQNIVKLYFFWGARCKHIYIYACTLHLV